MRVAIVSDTHMPRGARRLPDGCVERLRAADLILHAGDLIRVEVLDALEALGPPVHAICGNVDDAAVRARLPETRVVDVGGARIGMVHDPGPKAGRLARLRDRFRDADAVVFGHTHLPEHLTDPRTGFQAFNPGSPTERRRAPGHTMGLATVGEDGTPAFELLHPLMELSVLFAGTGGSVPTARRALPATLVTAGGDRLLFDCGRGTQRQLLRAGGLPDLDAIFLTHFHADHWLGLPGMLKTFDLRGRETALTVYGPPGLTALLAGLRPLVGRVGYPLELVELERHEAVGFEAYVVEAVPVDHRVPAFGYALIEDDRPGRFDVERATALGVTPGPDFGRLQRGETVGGVTADQVMGQDRPGRRVVLSGDTRPCQALEAAAHAADLLVHESTFLDADGPRARETGHSTARQAAELARDADVTQLALTHLSTRYFPREVRAEARTTFSATAVPHDFDVVDVPFPERGAPMLRKLDVEGEPGPPE